MKFIVNLIKKWLNNPKYWKYIPKNKIYISIYEIF